MCCRRDTGHLPNSTSWEAVKPLFMCLPVPAGGFGPPARGMHQDQNRALDTDKSFHVSLGQKHNGEIFKRKGKTPCTGSRLGFWAGRGEAEMSVPQRGCRHQGQAKAVGTGAATHQDEDEAVAPAQHSPGRAPSSTLLSDFRGPSMRTDPQPLPYCRAAHSLQPLRLPACAPRCAHGSCGRREAVRSRSRRWATAIAMLSGRLEAALHKPYGTPAVPRDAYILPRTQERMVQILTSAPLASDRSSSIQTRPSKT